MKYIILLFALCAVFAGVVAVPHHIPSLGNYATAVAGPGGWSPGYGIGYPPVYGPYRAVPY